MLISQERISSKMTHHVDFILTQRNVDFMRTCKLKDVDFTRMRNLKDVDFMSTRSSKVLISLKNTKVLIFSREHVSSKMLISLKKHLNVDFKRMCDHEEMLISLKENNKMLISQ